MTVNKRHKMTSLTVVETDEAFDKTTFRWVWKEQDLRNFRTSKYKNQTHFVQKNGKLWEVVEFPTNDVVQNKCECFQNKSEEPAIQWFLGIL